jgi:hypothetical protein
MNRGQIVPGTGPEGERAILRLFADWRAGNYPKRTEIRNQEIEEFLYDQWMLGENEDQEV